jgi:hypothetical protein
MSEVEGNTATMEAGAFASGVAFDDDAVGFSQQEQRENEGRDIPNGWHALTISKVTKCQSEDEIRLPSLKQYVKSAYLVTFKVVIEGRQFPITHTELVLGRQVKLVSARTNNEYVPTAARLGSGLQKATKVDGHFQGVLDAAMTIPLYGKFKTSDEGYINLEKITNYLPQSRN